MTRSGDESPQIRVSSERHSRSFNTPLMNRRYADSLSDAESEMIPFHSLRDAGGEQKNRPRIAGGEIRMNDKCRQIIPPTGTRTLTVAESRTFYSFRGVTHAVTCPRCESLNVDEGKENFRRLICKACDEWWAPWDGATPFPWTVFR